MPNAGDGASDKDAIGKSSFKEEAIWRESPTSAFYRAANDDFIEVNNHLNHLQKRGLKTPEASALFVTVIISIFLSIAFAESFAAYSWALKLSTAFAFSFSLFLLLATLMRQRLTLITLTKILRTTAHLTQPENAEMQRLALVPERFKADITSLNAAIERTGDRVHQIVSALNAELDALSEKCSVTQLTTNQSLENISLEHAAIVTNGENLRHTLKRVASDTSIELASVAANLQTVFQAKCAGLIEVIDERNRAFIADYLAAEESTLKSSQYALNEALSKQSKDYEACNHRLIKDFSARILPHSLTLSQQLDQSLSEIDKLYVKSRVGFESVFGQNLQYTENLLERMKQATDEKSILMRNMVAETIMEISQSFRENNARINISVQDLTQLMLLNKKQEEQLTSQISDFKSAVVEPLQFISSAFAEKSRAVATDVAFQITSFNEAASAASAQLAARFVAEAEQLGKTSDISISVVRDAVKGLESECESAVKRFSMSVDKAVNNLTNCGSNLIDSEIVPMSCKAAPVAGASLPTEPTKSSKIAPSSQKLHRSVSGQSWLSDILARADEDDLYSSFSLKPEGLAKIAPILRQVNLFVEPKALFAAWNTFKERNTASFDHAFTKEGRLAVRKIKSSIDNDNELSGFVEGYLTKVENLLREAYASNEDDALLAYMVSTAGKIYTILAFAAERI